jgi:hypothetical protein
MTRRYRFVAVSLAVAMIVASSPRFASANAILSYTGKPFTSIVDSAAIPSAYDTTMFISVRIELANPLGANWDVMPLYGMYAVVHWMVSDGRDVFTDINYSFLHSFQFSTDGTGAITGWFLRVGQPDSPRDIFSGSGFFPAVDYGSICLISSCGPGNTDVGVNTFSPGTWVQSVSVPEPSTLNCLLVALAGLGFALRKTKTATATSPH